MSIGEKATEPGLSLGGSVCNSLLKALYDFENGESLVDDERVDDYGDYAVEDNLFDDDDASIPDNDSFGSLQFEETISGASLSWAGLLRKMKDEMENQGHEQVPVLSTSRKFDLSEPVHLLPPNFDHKLNRKFALLVGCNYKGKFGELRNSHSDVQIMKDYIVNVHGFPEQEDYMTVLLDDNTHKKPTHNNIITAMKQIALRSRPGDAVFIQFVGHGGRILDVSAETDCYDEVFAPTDFNKRGLISEKTLFRSLIVRMAEDVTVTMLLDSCDTGVVFDMPFSWETSDDNGEAIAKLSLNDNFSFIRCLNVVKQMYDSSAFGDEVLESDDEDFNDRKDFFVNALKDVAHEAEMEVVKFSKKTKKMVKKMIEAAAESDDDDDDDDYRQAPDERRNERAYAQPRSESFDDGDDSNDSDSDSDDSYEARIVRNY